MRAFFAFVSLLLPLWYAGSALAATISFSGDIDVVAVDDGTGDLAGNGVGTPISGTIDDVTAAGSVSNGVGTVDFTCCIAAGGLEVTNDLVLDASTAATANAIQNVRTFVAGDMIDLIDLEGDTDNGAGTGRIEVGLSFVFDASTFPDSSPSNYPFDPNDLLFTLFFLVEEDGNNDVYNALGLVDDLRLPPRNGAGGPNVIPLPAGGLLLISGLIGLVYLNRRR